MAKKTPTEYKPGQHVLVKLSNGRIEEARINHVIQHSDGMSCKWILATTRRRD